MDYEKLKTTLYAAVDRAVDTLKEKMPDQGVVYLDVTGTSADVEQDTIATCSVSFVIAGLVDDTWIIDDSDVKYSEDPLG